VQQPWLQMGSLALYRPTPHLLRMPDPITRLNAALEGRYAIERELGEGRMAQKVRAIYDQSLTRWGHSVLPSP